MKQKIKTLPEFISETGDAAVAKMLGVKRRSVCDWRLVRRYPRQYTAMKIVKLTKGEVTLESIYSDNKPIRHQYTESSEG